MAKATTTPKRQTVASLVGKDIAGLRANVRFAYDSTPMVRNLLRAERIQKKGVTWFYLYWTPEAATPEGKMDCGYSGFEETYHAEDPPKVEFE